MSYRAREYIAGDEDACEAMPATKLNWIGNDHAAHT